MSLVGYARVSTAERRQMLDRQLDTIITASTLQEPSMTKRIGTHPPSQTAQRFSPSLRPVPPMYD